MFRVVLEVNRNPKVDAVLEVGAVTETMEVKADAPMVETTVPALGQTVNSQDIEELPLVNRAAAAQSKIKPRRGILTIPTAEEVERALAAS